MCVIIMNNNNSLPASNFQKSERETVNQVSLALAIQRSSLKSFKIFVQIFVSISGKSENFIGLNNYVVVGTK